MIPNKSFRLLKSVFASCGRTTWNVLLFVGHVWPKLLLGGSHSTHPWGCPSPECKGTPSSVELQCPVHRAHYIGSRVKHQSWLSLSHQPFSSTGVWLQILKCPVLHRLSLLLQIKTEPAWGLYVIATQYVQTCEWNVCVGTQLLRRLTSEKLD